jgi:hypothetical protein
VVRSGPRIDAVVLVADGSHDPSQETNGRELRRLGVACLGTLPRGTSQTLAHDPVITSLTEMLGRIPDPPA